MSMRQGGRSYDLLQPRGLEGRPGPSYVADVFVFPGSICLLNYKSKKCFHQYLNMLLAALILLNSCVSV